jgi:DNA-binding IclR family transcriptional regulator
VIHCKTAERSGVKRTVKLNKTDENVVSALKNAGKGLTLGEIAQASGEPPKKVFKSLRKLFENEMIDCENRQYRLLKT